MSSNLYESVLSVFYGFIFFSLQIALCAYLVTIAKTSRNLLCGSMSCAAENFTEIMDETEGRLCLDYGLDERTVYILILILFVILSTPLLAMNITNNTFVQYLGTILRWMTILGKMTHPTLELQNKSALLVVMIVPFVGSRASEHKFSYSGTNWAAIPMMFGISNSAFGCHETLPSLLFPISQKRHNFTMLALTFGGIMVLYFSLSTTALISFDGDLIADVYLLNFQVKDTFQKSNCNVFIF